MYENHESVTTMDMFSSKRACVHTQVCVLQMYFIQTANPPVLVNFPLL